MALSDVPAGDRTKLAISTSTDSIKQVLTLSAGILTFSVTFSKEIAKGATEGDQFWLRATWVLLGVAILGGVWALLALTGIIGKQSSALDIYSGNLRLPAAIQMLSFALALISLALFGLFAFSGA